MSGKFIARDAKLRLGDLNHARRPGSTLTRIAEPGAFGWKVDVLYSV